MNKLNIKIGYTILTLGLALVVQGCSDSSNSSSTKKEDPLFPVQWHLNNTGSELQEGAVAGFDINVMPVWEAGNLGENVVITITDGGVSLTHEDLNENVGEGSWNFIPKDDGSDVNNPATTGCNAVSDSHGTAVAGLIAAVKNDIGVRGVAPRSLFVANNFLCLFDKTSDNVLQNTNDIVEKYAEEVLLRSSDYSRINNMSWYADGGNVLQLGFPEWDKALDTGVKVQDKGVIYIMAAGDKDYNNMTDLGARTSYSAFTSNSNVLVVSSIDSRGMSSASSAPGVNILVSGPSNSIDNPTPALYSTAIGEDLNIDIFSGISDLFDKNNYTNGMTGTGGATAIVSGVVALMLNENPNLTWRDVRWILAYTARPLDASNDTGDRENSPLNENATYSTKTGFGLVDATAAVNMGSTFEALPEQVSCVINPSVDSRDPIGVTTVSFTLNGCEIETLESADVTGISIDTDIQNALAKPENIEVSFTGPNNTLESVIITSHECYDNSKFINSGVYEVITCPNGYNNWKFSSIKHLGETVSNGDIWTLKVTNKNTDGYGIFVDEGTLALTLKGFKAP